jgi:hypothetical protein
VRRSQSPLGLVVTTRSEPPGGGGGPLLRRRALRTPQQRRELFQLLTPHDPRVLATRRPECMLDAGGGEELVKALRARHREVVRAAPAYTTAQRAIMVFDAPACTVVNDPGRAERELWASLA